MGVSLNQSGDPKDICFKLNHPRTHELKQWFGLRKISDHLQQCRNVSFGASGLDTVNNGSVNIMEMIASTEGDYGLQKGEKTSYFFVAGYVTQLFSNDRPPFYLACQVCKKKVIDEETGYKCFTCNRLFTIAQPTWGFSVRISDYSDSAIFNVYGEQGDLIMGMQAVDYFAIKDDKIKVRQV